MENKLFNDIQNKVNNENSELIHKLWKHPEDPSSLSLPTRWYYAETNDGRFLYVPIEGVGIRLEDSLDGATDLCNERCAKQTIRIYRNNTGDRKTKFTIKSIVICL